MRLYIVRSTVGTERWAGLYGVLFGAALIAAFALLDLPNHDDGDQVVNDFYANRSGRLRVALAAYLLVAAGLAFVGFVWLAARQASSELAESRVAATLLAVAAAVLLAAAGASQGPTYGLSVDAFDEPLTALNRFDVHEAYGLVLVGYCFAGVAVILLCRVAHALPRPLVLAGYIVGVLSFATIFFLPLFLLPLWAVVAGGWLIVRGSRSPA